MATPDQEFVQAICKHVGGGRTTTRSSYDVNDNDAGDTAVISTGAIGYEKHYAMWQRRVCGYYTIRPYV